MPPLAPDIKEACRAPKPSRNPKTMADRAIDSWGECSIKHAGAVAAYGRAEAEFQTAPTP